MQVAELMAFMAKHRKLSCFKIVEVIAETTAPLTTMEELLARIPPKRVCSILILISPWTENMIYMISFISVTSMTWSILFSRMILKPFSWYSVGLSCEPTNFTLHNIIIWLLTQELPPEPTPDPAVVGIESEPKSSTVGKELGDVEVPKAKPLSPFTMWAAWPVMLHPVILINKLTKLLTWQVCWSKATNIPSSSKYRKCQL